MWEVKSIWRECSKSQMNREVWSSCVLVQENLYTWTCRENQSRMVVKAVKRDFIQEQLC